MFSKKSIADQGDRISLAWQKSVSSAKLKRISLTPVFHVERIYNDRFFDELLRFVVGYRDATGCRAVLTCMTPFSPILKKSIQDAGFTAEEYWRRIASLSEYGIIGLHGHFVRFKSDGSLVPSHFAFNDLSLVEKQMKLELEALLERGLVTEDLLIYSAGWWFTSPQLREILAELGFTWDYSISTSPFNVCPGSHALELFSDSSSEYYIANQKKIRTTLAACSISKKGRSFVALSKITSGRTVLAKDQTVRNYSLYSHDYDLDTDSALEMTRTFKEAGIDFSEPGAASKPKH